MGLVRSLLALAVVLVHAQAPYALVGGRNAVQMFYVISGFLISFVLVERNAYPQAKAFYVNRYLRLYPVYAVVLVLTLLSVPVITHDDALWRQLSELPASAVVWLGLSNLLIFGQDWLMFAAVRGGETVFAMDFNDSVFPLWTGLMVPQAWTLGVELSFYLLAPWIVHRRGLVWALLIASLALRAVFIKAGFGMSDPWDYRFFPTELALFLIGVLLHQLAYPFVRRHLDAGAQRWAGVVSVVLVVGALLAYPLLPWGNLAKSGLLFAVFLPCLPFLFLYQARNRWDREVGELSYPIYICHWLVIALCDAAYRHWGVAYDQASYLALVVIGTLAFAYVLNRYVAQPVEAMRDRFRTR